MNPDQLLEQIESKGGWLVLLGDRIKYRVPQEARPLIEELRQKREDVIRILRERANPPQMPVGVQLVRWNPKQPPVLLSRWSVVTDPALFAIATLEQLGAALSGQGWQSGNWSTKELLDRLQQVGVEVELRSRSGIERERNR